MRFGRMTAIVLVLLGSLGVSTPPDANANSATGILCGDCRLDFENTHDFSGVSTLDFYECQPKQGSNEAGEPECHTRSKPGTCPDHHNVCDADDPPSFEPLTAALEADDLSALAEFVNENPTHVQFNESRSALQILGCKAVGVKAQLPLSAVQAARLSEALAALRGQ